MEKYEFDEKLSECFVCKSRDIKDYITDFMGINISMCDNCGFQFMNPQYTDIYISEYYSKYTNANDFDYWHKSALYCHDFYCSLIERHSRKGKMFDVGCGHGYLLEAAKKRGWSVRGYDTDKDATQVVADRLGAEVNYGDFLAGDFGDEYDLVTMHQVLEHLKKPNEYLKKIHSLVKKDGHIFVAVPNIMSLANKIKHQLERIGVRNKSIGKYYDTSHHVLYFEPSTLITLLEKHDFEVVYQRNCHSARPNQSSMKRFIMRNITDHFFAKSAFLVIAKKN